MKRTEESPGIYHLKTLRLNSKYSQHGGLDLSLLMVEFNYYEDLFANNVTGELVITDSFNLIANLPIVEGDTITFRATINSSDPNAIKVDEINGEPGHLDIELEIIKIRDRTTFKKDTQIYTLVLASNGWSDNTSQRISKGYTFSTYSDIVEDVFTNSFLQGGIQKSLPDKGIDVEPSEGSYDIIIPNWSPLKTINWCASRAVKKDAVNYLFYENSESFNFKPISFLLEQDPIGSHYLTLSNYKDSNSPEKIYLNFHTIEYGNSTDFVTNASNGVFGSRMVEYDIYKKQATEYSNSSSSGAPNYIFKEGFNYLTNYRKITHCDSNMLNSEPLIQGETNDLFNTNPGTPRLYNVATQNNQSPRVESFDHAKWMMQRISHIDASRFIKLIATGFGIFNRKIGDIIEFSPPSSQTRIDPTSGRADTRLAGNYLISALKRRFTPEGHTMVLELIKDDFYSLQPDEFWQGRLSGTDTVAR